MDAAAPKLVLVVDDEEDVTEVLQYLIEDEGYRVVTATTVQDAMEKASEGGLAAAILDVSMGAASGLQIARALRAAPATAQLPIIIFTGLPEPTVRDQFTAYDLFVSKGVDLTDLVDRLGRLIGVIPPVNESSTARPN